MDKNNIIGIIADDLRQIYLAKYLSELGYSVQIITTENYDNIKYTINLEKCYFLSDIYDLIGSSNVIVTPIPFIKMNNLMNLNDFIFNISKKENLDEFLLYAGQIEEHSVNQLNSYNIKYMDYYKSESLTIFNTIATAEGIIAEAIINKNTNLHNSNVLILGFGKCAKTLAHKLKGIGAKVTVCATNKTDLSIAESLGYNTLCLHNLIMSISEYNYIFNTIPTLILEKNLLSKMKSDTLILDIASAKGGVDKEFADNHGIKVIHSLGIPGKYSAKSSGIALGDDLLKYISDIILDSA